MATVPFLAHRHSPVNPNVFLTRRIPPEGIDLLRQHTNLHIFPHDRCINRDEIIASVASSEAILCMLSDRIDAAVIEAAPLLKVISNYAVGFNNIDIDAARRRNIVVTNTPGVLTDTTADTAFALIMACSRRIASAERWLRTNEFDGWAPLMFLGHDLTGKTLGILGAGRIGQAVAKRGALGFDMRILYTARNTKEELEKKYGASRVDLDRLLAESDVISIHVPLTAETNHLIGRREFELMKHSAVLVNTARGPVIDEHALVDALESRRIFAAGLDVFEFEPHISDRMKALDSIVILPHIGSASFLTRAKMSVIAARNILEVLAGREPMHRVV